MINLVPFQSLVKEMGKSECIQIKEERMEDNITPQNESRMEGDSKCNGVTQYLIFSPPSIGSVESGADEDKGDMIGHTQTNSLFQDYDPQINADQESEGTNQKLPSMNAAHNVQAQGYSGLWTPISTETDSEDPACSYASELSPTHVALHINQQQQAPVVEKSTLFPVKSFNVKPEATILDSEPYGEIYQCSSNEYYCNNSSNNLHPQNRISYEASKNVGNLAIADKCLAKSKVNVSENTSRPKVGIVQRYMAGHKMQHRVGKREKRYVCGFCRKSFTCPKYLQSHQRVHTGEKPFSCSQCGKKFGQAGYLKKHLNVHTGEKPFVCPLCGKRFADSSNLIRHKSVHIGQRPFVCIQCGERFPAKHNLRVHLEINHSVMSNYTLNI
uniref:C2H2-type domain-containing protein n=1 Tax=Esox lucius TaxID=8010 RepID=A0A6Q2WV63_ESOLU